MPQVAGAIGASSGQNDGDQGGAAQDGGGSKLDSSV